MTGASVASTKTRVTKCFMRKKTMQVIRTKTMHLIVAIVSIAGMLAIQPASAVSRCGNFEMVPMPERVTEIVPFENGEASAIGSSADNPSVQVLRYFDGGSWTEQPLPAEAEGFAFGAAGGTPDGHAWFLGTRASTVYEIDVIMLHVRRELFLKKRGNRFQSVAQFKFMEGG